MNNFLTALIIGLVLMIAATASAASAAIDSELLDHLVEADLAQTGQTVSDLSAVRLAERRRWIELKILNPHLERGEDFEVLHVGDSVTLSDGSVHIVVPGDNLWVIANNPIVTAPAVAQTTVEPIDNGPVSGGVMLQLPKSPPTTALIDSLSVSRDRFADLLGLSNSIVVYYQPIESVSTSVQYWGSVVIPVRDTTLDYQFVFDPNFHTRVDSLVSRLSYLDQVGFGKPNKSSGLIHENDQFLYESPEVDKEPFYMFGLIIVGAVALLFFGWIFLLPMTWGVRPKKSY